MRRSILLFLVLIFAILLWKITESTENTQWNDATVKEVVSESDANKIAKK